MEIERFNLVDRIVAVDLAAGWIRAAAHLPRTAPVFEGHFPGRPLLPGVLQAELMGQAAGLLLMAQKPGCLAVLVGLERARFRRPVVPGDRLEARATQVYAGDQLSVFDCELHRGDECVAAAQVRLALTQAESATVSRHVAQLLARHGLSPSLESQA